MSNLAVIDGGADVAQRMSIWVKSAINSLSPRAIIRQRIIKMLYTIATEFLIHWNLDEA
jgi:hypothetical protein